jgi:hypothetical protein
MHCPACRAPVVAFAVPADLRGYLPSEATHAALCTSCLRLHQAEETGGAFTDVHPAFPTGEAGVAMAIASGLLESLALNKAAIADLFREVESQGADPYLLLETLAESEELDPVVDLAGRRRQLEQLL